MAKVYELTQEDIMELLHQEGWMAYAALKTAYPNFQFNEIQRGVQKGIKDACIRYGFHVLDPETL